MNFLLKIVEGPNKGAEIALVEGVAVTLGKADECDIVLADPTLPDAPFTVEATASGVTLDGSAMEPYHVKSAGSTAFAVGPSDVAWSELVWPQVEKAAENEDGHETEDGRRDEEVAVPADKASSSEPTPESAPRRRRGCLGCLVALVVFLLILLGVAWFFKGALQPKAEELWGRLTGKAVGMTTDANGDRRQDGGSSGQDSFAGLSVLAAKYGLALANDAGRVTLSGNFRTRAERLAATAEAYECQPGVELDLSDDESFATAATDALFTLTEGALTVSAATNRLLVIAGSARSAAALKKTLEALNADLPKLRNVDVSGVQLGRVVSNVPQDEAIDPDTGGPVAETIRRKSRKIRHEPNIPVCGILMTPYPCLVMQNGARVLEGATIGDSTILKITADSVVVTNASGRFTWKP